MLSSLRIVTLALSDAITFPSKGTENFISADEKSPSNLCGTGLRDTSARAAIDIDFAVDFNVVYDKPERNL